MVEVPVGGPVKGFLWTKQPQGKVVITLLLDLDFTKFDPTCLWRSVLESNHCPLVLRIIKAWQFFLARSNAVPNRCLRYGWRGHVSFL